MSQQLHCSDLRQKVPLISTRLVSGAGRKSDTNSYNEVSGNIHSEQHEQVVHVKLKYTIHIDMYCFKMFAWSFFPCCQFGASKARLARPTFVKVGYKYSNKTKVLATRAFLPLVLKVNQKQISQSKSIFLCEKLRM